MARRVSLLALALVAAACGRYLSAGVAVVDGVSISKGEFERRLAQALGDPEQAGQGGRARLEVERQVVADLIREELVRQEVERRGVAPTEREVAARLEEIRASFPSPGEFQQALAREGLDLAELRDGVRSRLALERLRERLVARAVTEADLRALYAQRRPEFERIGASHILFAIETPADEDRALTEARRALGRLRAGEDFAALARRLSDDPGSKSRGGELGVVGRGEFVPEFERAAFALPTGEVSEPVRTQFGYHLILVTDRQVSPLEEVRERLREEVAAQRGDRALAEWLDRTLARADIVVNPRFGDWDPRTATIVERRFFVPASPETRANP